jgi:uncharacterized membrane protein YphA (DoxX/SURF4 family)
MMSEKMKHFAPIVLRIGLSLVFLWFGTQQLLNTGMWTGLIPDWITSASGFEAATFVYFNGAFEIIFGICLLVLSRTSATLRSASATSDF